MNTDADVLAIGPMLPAFRVEQIRLGFEEAGFSERQFDLPGLTVLLHRHVAPGFAGVNRAAGVRGDDFAPERCGATEIGAEQGAPAVAPAAVVERETDAVADETHEAFAGRGFHEGNGLRHFSVPVVCRMTLRFRRWWRKAMPQVPLAAGQAEVALLHFGLELGHGATACEAFWGVLARIVANLTGRFN